jgi:hypothetical protein
MIAEGRPGMPSGLHCQSPALRGSSFSYPHAHSFVTSVRIGK